MYDFVIVGAGFAGAVCAQQLAEAGKRVLVLDKRDHIGGNAHDRYDAHGVLIHPYGPHIFHTNSKRVFAYLSRFTDWRFYEHRVLSMVEGTLYPFPINRTTINRLYKKDLTETQVGEFLESVRDHERAGRASQGGRTSEDVVLSSVGPDLCDKFFRHYTQKQWGYDLSELSAGVAARIPTRTNDDDRYFEDVFQFMPSHGYTAMFEKMLASDRIEVRVDTNFFDIKDGLTYENLIYTGPIDAFYDYKFGKLPYRSLRFEHSHLADQAKFQDVGTVNYPNDHDYTRITEFRHLTGQDHAGTSIVREIPQAEGEPFYPIPRTQNEEQFKRYEALAREETGVTFVGRLAQYRYYNMDQVVAAALAAAEKLAV